MNYPKTLGQCVGDSGTVFGKFGDSLLEIVLVCHFYVLELK